MKWVTYILLSSLLGCVAYADIPQIAYLPELQHTPQNVLTILQQQSKRYYVKSHYEKKLTMQFLTLYYSPWIKPFRFISKENLYRM